MQKYFAVLFLFIIKFLFLTCSRDSNSKNLFTKLNQRNSEESTREIEVNSENNKNKIKLGKNGTFYFLTNYSDTNNIFTSPDSEERTYHSNYFNEAPQTFVDLLNIDPIIIDIDRFNNRDTKNIGINGILYCITNYTDESNIFDPLDIEEKTKFNTIITKNGYEHNVTCKLFKPINEKLRLFCKLNDQLNVTFGYVRIQETSIIYNGYKINIINTGDITVKQNNYEIPFLYSDTQIINIEKGKKYYNLTFKIGSYNNEQLLLFHMSLLTYQYIILENCITDKNHLICKVSKDKLEEISSNKNARFSLIYYDPFHVPPPAEYNLINVFTIYVNFTNIIEKKLIYVELTKLLIDTTGVYSNVVFETNITSISNVVTHYFSLEVFHTVYASYLSVSCFLKKASGKPLLLICKSNFDGKMYLTSFKGGILKDDLNVKYNFFLSKHLDTVFTVKNEKWSDSLMSYPYNLKYNDFDLFYIYYFFNRDARNIKIRLNPDSTDLNCYYVYDYSYVCTSVYCEVPKSHFDGKESGYYYTYNTSKANDFFTFYELSPINVFIPKDNEIVFEIKGEDNENIIKIGQKGTLVFTTNSDNNKINSLEAEEKIFETKIRDDFNNKYDVICIFWIDSYRNFKILCKLNENLKYPYQNIILDKISFELQNYSIIVIQEEYVEVEQLEYNIPFLYSDRQVININNYDKSYILKFKLESYYNDILYIYGNSNNYAIIDKCIENEKELNCKISKEKLEEILIYNNEQFKIGAINDNIGIIELDNILDITINNLVIEKEDIYVELTKLITSDTEVGVPFGFETNVTDIPNIISDIFDIFYFKKTTGNPLMLLSISTKEGDFHFEKINKEIILDNIHYKYNFIIQPYENNTKISIKGNGTDIKIVYPNELNFRSIKETLTIRFIMTNPLLAKDIKLINEESSYLECENLKGIKKCNVPYIHFIGKQSGNYYTYHSNHLGELSQNYEISAIKVNLPTENIINIFIDDYYNQHEINIGPNGIIFFITDYNDNNHIFDSEKISFETSIFDEYKIHFNVTCRFWKPIKDNIRIFCKLKESIDNERYIKINSFIFSYNNYDIAIVNRMNLGIKIKQYNLPIPFLYSDKQIINIEKGKEFYEVIFKIEEYNNEQLILTAKSKFNNIILFNCDKDLEYLICKITKEKIEEIISFSGEVLTCHYLHNLTGTLFSLSNILDININYNDIEKENVYINIMNLLEDNIDINNYFAYKTNVISMSNIISSPFLLKNDKNINYSCFMKKTMEKPLLLLCESKYEGKFELGEIKQEIILENINIKYNLIIKPVTNKELINVGGNGTPLLFEYPNELNFYFQDEFIINYLSDKAKDSRSIKLNPDLDELLCSSLNYRRKCIVDKDYFEGKESDYFYTYYKNNKGSYSIFYELSPIKVFIPKDNDIIINIRKIEHEITMGQKGALILEIDYNDNTLNISYLEEIIIKTNFYDDTINKKYDVDCKLWKPEYRASKLICKFYEILISEYIKLNLTFVDYKEQRIVIVCKENIKIKQLNSSFAFLYNDKQVININDTNEYQISFKKEIYNNELLILYKDGIKNIILDCKEKTTEIICTFKKDKILEILSYNLEEFYLYQLTETEGMLKFDNVFEIIFIYNNVNKKDIYLSINKLLTPKIQKNNFIVYETNITEASRITSDYFNIKQNTNGELKCLFKKNNEKDKLLLLCNADSSGTFSLGVINEINLYNINILYNFKISQTQNDETCIISQNEGIKILFVYPEELDFNYNNSYIINYKTDYPEKLKGIKLNNDSLNELECINKKGIKECIVPYNHFTKSGNYYTHYNYSLDYKLISYEISTIKIILKNEKDNNNSEENYAGIIAGSVIGGLIIIGIIIFFIIRYYRRKNSEASLSSGNNDSLVPKSVQVELKEGSK